MAICFNLQLEPTGGGCGGGGVEGSDSSGIDKRRERWENIVLYIVAIYSHLFVSRGKSG